MTARMTGSSTVREWEEGKGRQMAIAEVSKTVET
jgi:hypothetical protein